MIKKKRFNLWKIVLHLVVSLSRKEHAGNPKFRWSCVSAIGGSSFPDNRRIFVINWHCWLSEKFPSVVTAVKALKCCVRRCLCNKEIDAHTGIGTFLITVTNCTEDNFKYIRHLSQISSHNMSGQTIMTLHKLHPKHTTVIICPKHICRISRMPT
jgi:hypothetical protein